jgi:enamine deaminase RidA (YjgF/YER057c/UK114 family)
MSFNILGIHMNIQRYGTTRRYSHMVAHNSTVYLVEVPANLDADITAQTENLLTSVEQQLIQAHSDKSLLLMVTIYLADMADYDAMNVVWEDWLPEDSAPVRACLQAKLSSPQYRIEVVLTAAQHITCS